MGPIELVDYDEERTESSGCDDNQPSNRVWLPDPHVNALYDKHSLLGTHANLLLVPERHQNGETRHMAEDWLMLLK